MYPNGYTFEKLEVETNTIDGKTKDKIEKLAVIEGFKKVNFR